MIGASAVSTVPSGDRVPQRDFIQLGSTTLVAVVPQQLFILRDLLKAYANGGSSPDAITDQVARRSKQNPETGQAPFALDTLTRFMVDREDYAATQAIALFRLFLEPVGEPVNKWTMSIDGNEDHSETYTFADKFSSTYIPAITAKLETAWEARTAPL